MCAKLINPTDDALRRAVATEATGITDITDKCPWEKCVMLPGQLFGVQNGVHVLVPDFPRSMDAVLPLLEKWQHVPISWLSGRIGDGDPWEVRIYNAAHEGGYVGHAKTLPRAACIALLRANGVEVIVT